MEAVITSSMACTAPIRPHTSTVLSRCQRKKNAAEQAENRPSAALSVLLLCKSIKISLDKHDWRSLISGAGGQVTERADQICQPYKVAEGDSIKIERLDAEVGSVVTFDQVLAVNNGELTIGCPTVENATVSATVEKVGKGKKVIV